MTTATTVAAPAPMTFGDVLRLDVMRRVWYAQIVSLFGDFLAIYAVISVVSFKLGGSANQVTWVQISYLLPLAVLSPLAGVFVDRWPLKPTLVASDLIRAALALLLITTTSIWQLYVVLFALSSVSSFFIPAQSVTIRHHVPREGLLVANSLMQIAAVGSRIFGPAAAGLLFAAVGPGLCYSLDVASFVASAALIGSVAIRRLAPATAAPVEKTESQIGRIWSDILEGVAFIMGHGAVQFVVLAMAAALFTVGCFGPLIAIYVRDTLKASAGAFGLVSGTIGVGMLIGTQSMRRFAQRFRNETMVLIGLLGVGVGALLLGLANILAIAFLATFTIGLAFAAIIVPAQTLLQQETPQDVYGRVSSSVNSVLFLAQILGLVLSGVLAETLGVRLVFRACAALAAVLAASGRLFLHRNQ